jgi:hypothetical protein
VGPLQAVFWPEPLAEASRYSKLITSDLRSDLPRPAGAFLAANPRARAAAGGYSSCGSNLLCIERTLAAKAGQYDDPQAARLC